MKFAERVSAFMATHHYTASQFGRAVLGDPNFVPRLLKGRQVTERIMDKVDAWMATPPDLPGRALANGPPPIAERAGPTRTAPIVWTRQLDAYIVRLHHQGDSLEEIAAAIRVSRSALRRRGVAIGLLESVEL